MAREYVSICLVSSTGGEPTALAAAEAFARGVRLPNFPLPSGGWHEVGRSGGSVMLQSGPSWARAVQGPDGTWKVDQLSRSN